MSSHSGSATLTQFPVVQTAATAVPATGLFQQTGQPLICRTGIVQPRTGPGIPLRGTHVLLGTGGEIVASLFSETLNLNQFNGLGVLVCGVDAGVVEGVQAINALFVLPLFLTPFLGFPFFF